jgi:coproporphyrinogen III oxidase
VIKQEHYEKKRLEIPYGKLNESELEFIKKVNPSCYNQIMEERELNKQYNKNYKEEKRNQRGKYIRKKVLYNNFLKRNGMRQIR